MATSEGVEFFCSGDQLLQRILSVDFYCDLPRDVSGNLSDVQKRIRWHRPLEELPSFIDDLAKYHRCFFPLYMTECLQMLASSKYMSMGYPLRVYKVRYQLIDNFALVNFYGKTGFPFIPGDLVLLYIGGVGHDVVPDSGMPTIQESVDTSDWDDVPLFVSVPADHPLYQDTLKHSIGFVTSVSKNQCTLKILIRPPDFCNMATFDMRSIARMETMQYLLENTSNIIMGSASIEEPTTAESWYVSKLCSFATSMREFRALCQMKSMPLVNKMLGKYSGPVMSDSIGDDKTCYLEGVSIPEKLKRSLEAAYNDAQLRSIRNSLTSNGITLIQGPPGTGKTTTIIGLISAILEHDMLPPSCNAVSGPIYEHNAANAVSRCPWFTTDARQSEPLEVAFDELNLTEAHMEAGVHRYDSYACMKPSTSTAVETIVVPTMRQSKRRILICAPSNAAIDEIVRRLVRPVTGGIFNAEGERYNPNVTRIGPNFHDDLKQYSLKSKVDALGYKLYGRIYNKTKYHARHRLTRETLNDSDIICSTLSACGSPELFVHRNMFDTLIIDEATQAVELSTLIALSIGCRRVILVGDPCQLSATVCSNVAVSLKYDRSLFQRLQMCGYPVNLLDIQYRMDPLISRFPSMYFYRNQLKDAPSVYERQKSDWREFPLLRPAVFYAIDSLQMKNETSYMNEMEAELVCQLLELILDVLAAEPGFELSSLEQRVAVITTYSAQVALLKETIARRHPQLVVPSVDKDSILPGISYPKLLFDVSSVDGFQGMEKEIVIFSAVRTSYADGQKPMKKGLQDFTPPNILTIDQEPHDPKKLKKFSAMTESYVKEVESGKAVPDIRDVVDVSFIADRRRINVAITRACRNLFIVGNPRYLLGHTHWRALYKHYAYCGSIFLCKLGRNTLKPNYLKSWAKDYLQKDPVAYERFQQNPSLQAFVQNVMAH
ncbi:AAA domain family protein [Babesia bovis T2Bo]|uniref:Uncharacterized protein n=1 Tax=Babesia bovis TaxID=5865 RepID=A7AP93_BABBO|nr:AAA domain family protein [Babesia bovis T2Bo]EDO08377.1 AAA domain family protein [Babesia bovis T2Bo]|eukprot:XP_001611945.1 hypothetical protein [Babesia bovis T2Bo]